MSSNQAPPPPSPAGEEEQTEEEKYDSDELKSWKGRESTTTEKNYMQLELLMFLNPNDWSDDELNVIQPNVNKTQMVLPTHSVCVQVLSLFST